MKLFKNPVYIAGWSLWVGGLLIAPWIHDPFYLLALAVFFACLEALAVLDADGGDTFSEYVWRFYGGAKARFYLVTGLVLYMASLVISVWVPIFSWVGFGVLMVGLFWWLYDHFKYMGRRG